MSNEEIFIKICELTNTHMKDQMLKAIDRQLKGAEESFILEDLNKKQLKAVKDFIKSFD